LRSRRRRRSRPRPCAYRVHIVERSPTCQGTQIDLKKVTPQLDRTAAVQTVAVMTPAAVGRQDVLVAAEGSLLRPTRFANSAGRRDFAGLQEGTEFLNRTRLPGSAKRGRGTRMRSPHASTARLAGAVVQGMARAPRSLQAQMPRAVVRPVAAAAARSMSLTRMSHGVGRRTLESKRTLSHSVCT
jgi:hypothetical protein